MTKPRVAELDFIRAVAMLMVIILHVSAAYVAYSRTDSNVFYLGIILNQWSRICLPLFVFVSGFGLFYRYGEKGRLNVVKDFFCRRIYLVFLPYLVWSLIYMILRDVFNPSFHFIGLPFKVALLSYINWTFKENIHTPIWFVMMIVQLYAVFPILINPIEKISSEPRIAIAANFTVFLILTIYFRYFMTMSGIKIIDWLQKYYSVNLLGWYFYFLLGGIVAYNWSNYKEISLNRFAVALLYIITTLLVILEAYLGFLKYGQEHLGLYTSTRPAVVINSMAAIPLLFILAKKVMKWDIAARFFTLTARYSYGIFFVHPQVLTVVKQLMGFIYGTYTTRIFYFALVFILTVCGSYLFCYILDKMPFRTVLLGLDKKK